MTYRPKAAGNKEKILSLFFALCAIFLIIVSGITNRFGGIYQISAIIFGVVSIEFYLKYVGSDYVYDAADDYFKVKKQADSLENEIATKDKQLYDIKHELIAAQIKLEALEKEKESLQRTINANQLDMVKLETELEDSQNKKRRATTSSTI